MFNILQLQHHILPTIYNFVHICFHEENKWLNYKEFCKQRKVMASQVSSACI